MPPTFDRARPRRPQGAGLAGLLKPYAPLISTLVVLTILGNSLNLLVPKIISHAIDRYSPAAARAVDR